MKNCVKTLNSEQKKDLVKKLLRKRSGKEREWRNLVPTSGELSAEKKKT